MKRHTPPKPLNKWQASERFRQVGSQAIRLWNVQRRRLPKCGARRRDGGECQEVAMANGRCYRHGGKTPRGDDWHQRQWPGNDAANAMEKMSRKLAAKQKEDAVRERRMALAPKYESEAYRKWMRDHKPGDAKVRAAERERRRQDREARESIKRMATEPPRPQSPEVIELEQQIEALRAELAARQEFTKGVFS